MTVLTVEYYQYVTGDTVTAASAVAENLSEAENLVEEALGRRLSYGTRTEKVLVWWREGLAYPAAVPIHSVAASSRAEVWDEATLHNVVSDDPGISGFQYNFPEDPGSRVWGHRGFGSGYEADLRYATVTYTGGWTLEDMPSTLKMAIAKLAQALLPVGDFSAAPAGATMVRVGDVQVNRPRDMVTGYINSLVPGLYSSIARFHLGRL